MLETNKKKDKPEKILKLKSTKNNLISNSSLEDYAEVIPQKIENKQTLQHSNEKTNLKSINGNLEENFDNQNLDFSFGKDLQKETILNYKNNINKENNNSEKTDTNTNANSLKNKLNNTLNNDILEKRDIFSENLSSYHLTDSLSNLRDNNNLEENKKLQMIKEKFITNFKNKERGASLEKALTLFEKYQNFRIFNLNNQLNHSFSNFKEIPYRNLITQNTNSLSIIDNNNNKYKTKNRSSFSKLEIDYTNKKVENIINNHKKKKSENNINTINNKNINENNNINNKLILKKLIKRKKDKDKKIFSLNVDKKKGFFIRKVIREEKYFIDDDGKEKLIGIRQSTIDSQEKNENKDIKQDKAKKVKLSLKYKNKNITLLNQKKFAEYIKDKINRKINNNSISLQNKNQNNFNKNKNIQINTDFINNKKGNIDNCNNIKIVINKNNKINSNPKINLNFIKKYKNKTIKENGSIRNKIFENNNVIYKTEINDNKTFHLIKVDKMKNEKIIEYKPLITNVNINTNNNKAKTKIKDNLKILKCEKVDRLQNKTQEKKLIKSNFGISSSNPRIIIQQRQKYNKKNYSYKEIKNLSNSNITKSYKYISNKDLEKYFKKHENYLTIDTFDYRSDNKYKLNKIPYRNSPNKNRHNHTFYESKSFSCKKKSTSKSKNNKNEEDNNKIIKPKKVRLYRNKIDSSNTLETINNYENKTINTNRIYINKTGIHLNINKKEKEKNSKSDLNKKSYKINTSYNNINTICSYNNTEQK